MSDMWISKFKPRFGLRTLLVLIAFVAGVLSWGGHCVRRVRRVHEIAAQLEECDAAVEFGECRLLGLTVDGNRIPDWLWDTAGRAAFSDVESVSLVPESDAQIALLTELPTVREVDIDSGPSSATAIGVLASLPNLRALRFAEASIPDARLSELSNCESLETLELGESLIRPYQPLYGDRAISGLAEIHQLRSLQLVLTRGVTAEGVAKLGELQNLRELVLTGENNSSRDPRVDALPGLPNLEALQLRSFHVTEAGIDRLREFIKLRELTFYNCRIPENSLAILKTLSELRTLCIWKINLSPTQLGEVASLRKLKRLSLEASVSDASIRDLRNTMQGCEIERVNNSPTGVGF